MSALKPILFENPQQQYEVKPVEHYYEANDLIAMRNAFLAEQQLELDSFLIVHKEGRAPYQSAGNDFQTYLISPANKNELTGLKEAICIAILRDVQNQQILMPYCISANHWVTVQIIIQNRSIILRIHDSAHYYNYQNNEIGKMLKEFFSFNVEQMNNFLLNGGNSSGCTIKKEYFETMLQRVQRNENEKYWVNFKIEDPTIFPIQKQNTYCGGYTQRLINRLALNPFPNLSQRDVWGCGDKDDKTLRIEDALFVSQYCNERDKSYFGKNTTGKEYKKSEEHKIAKEKRKEALVQLTARLVETIKNLSKDVVEQLSIKIQQFDNSNISLLPETNQDLIKRIRVLYHFCETELRIPKNLNPIAHFFKTSSDNLSQESPLNSDIRIEKLWQAFLDIIFPGRTAIKSNPNSHVNAGSQLSAGFQPHAGSQREKSGQDLSNAPDPKGESIGNSKANTAGSLIKLEQIQGNQQPFKHQTCINQALELKYKAFRELNTKISGNHLEFGFVNLLETVCCGALLEKINLASVCGNDKNSGCPKCGAHEFNDQLFCMSLRLLPNNISSDKDRLMFDLLRNAIAKKRYFLLEHLLLMRHISKYINLYDRFNKTLLHYAIEEMDSVSTSILIKHGANVNPLVRYRYYSLEYLYHIKQEKGKLKKQEMNSSSSTSNFDSDIVLQTDMEGTSGDTSNDHNSEVDEEGFKTLEQILKHYGAISRVPNADVPVRVLGTGNYNGNYLHLDCKNADDVSVYFDIQHENVNTVDCQNFTPLAMLASNIGNEPQNARSLSILNLSKIVQKLSCKKDEVCQQGMPPKHELITLELILSFQKLNALSYDNNEDGIEFSIANELYCFLKHATSRKIHHFGLHWALSFGASENSEDKVLFFCRPQDINWGKETTGIFNPNQFFERDILDYIQAQTQFSGSIIIPCCLEQNFAFATLKITKNNQTFSVSIEMTEFTGNKASFFDEKIRAWLNSKWANKITALISNHNTFISFDENYSVQPSAILPVLLNAIRVFLESARSESNSLTDYSAYAKFKYRYPLVRRNGEIPPQFYKIMDYLSLDGNEILTALNTTKQDHIIEMLLSKKADLGINSLFPNVFSVAARQYNFGFINKLISLHIDPFFQEQMVGLIQTVNYDFQTMIMLLYAYTKHHFGDRQSLLHTVVTLFDGALSVRSHGGATSVNLIEGLLIKNGRFPELGKTLLEKENANGETPIFTAIANLNLEAVNVLINCGAQLMRKNRQGKYPIDVLRSIKDKCSSNNFKKILKNLKIKMSSQISGEHPNDSDIAHLRSTYGFEITVQQFKNGSMTFVKKMTDEMLDADDSDSELESDQSDTESAENEDDSSDITNNNGEGEDYPTLENSDNVDSDKTSNNVAIFDSQMELLNNGIMAPFHHPMMQQQPKNEQDLKFPDFSIILEQLKDVINQPLIQNIEEYLTKGISLSLLAFQVLDREESQALEESASPDSEHMQIQDDARKENEVTVQCEKNDDICLHNVVRFAKRLPDLQKIDYFKQLLIASGSLKQTRKIKLLQSLADFFRKSKSDELFMLSFFCDAISVNESTVNESFIEIYCKSFFDQNPEQCMRRVQILIKKNPLFTQFSYYLGSHCIPLLENGNKNKSCLSPSSSANPSEDNLCQVVQIPDRCLSLQDVCRELSVEELPSPLEKQSNGMITEESSFQKPMLMLFSHSLSTLINNPQPQINESTEVNIPGTSRNMDTMNMDTTNPVHGAHVAEMENVVSTGKRKNTSAPLFTDPSNNEEPTLKKRRIGTL